MLKGSLKLLQSLTSLSVSKCYSPIISTASYNCNVFAQNLHTTSLNHGKKDDMSYMIRKMSKPEEGTEGEVSFDLDSLKNKNDLFPDENTANQLFDGIPYKLLPICNVRASKNNTIFSITDYKGNVKHIYSCGIEGYTNCRKGTNIAAQATGLTFGKTCIRNGFKTVRCRIQGLGPGRLASMKGLEMAGLTIVSVTDATRVSWNPPRPRKRRRI